MENLRKDENVEQMKMKQRKFIEMIQTKLRHLLYRSRELLIPMSSHYNNFDAADHREDELVHGFNEVLELCEKYINPAAGKYM